MNHLLCSKYRNAYSPISPCEEEPSDMSGWVTEHDEKALQWSLKKKMGLFYGMGNTFFPFFATEID